MSPAGPTLDSARCSTEMFDAKDGKDVSIHTPSSHGLPWPQMPLHQAPPAMMQTNQCLTPAEVYNGMVAIGVAKSKKTWFSLCTMSILAGFYVGFGFTFCCAAIGLMGNTMYGALAFPTGLLLIILCGAELYTGNTCYMMTSLIERKTSLWHYFKICTVSWFFNLVGSLIMCQMQVAAQTWVGREDWVTKIALKKMSLDWDVVLVRGIFANWLVNLAVYQAMCARDVVGKAIACWTPICAFVAIGFEHSIANQYLIPMSMFLGSGVTTRDFIANNLIPATIGNWIGGFFFVGTFYAASYGETIPNFVEDVTERVGSTLRSWVCGRKSSKSSESESSCV